MLFDIIRDFFVQHVWGGIDSNGDYFYARLGSFISGLNFETYIDLDGTNYYVPIGGIDGADDYYVQGIAFSDWLSTTSTIITLVLILICIAFFIRWIFKVCSNAILLR